MRYIIVHLSYYKREYYIFIIIFSWVHKWYLHNIWDFNRGLSSILSTVSCKQCMEGCVVVLLFHQMSFLFLRGVINIIFNIEIKNPTLPFIYSTNELSFTIREANISFLKLTYILLTTELGARVRPLLNQIYRSSTQKKLSDDPRHSEADRYSLESGTPVWQLYKKCEIIEKELSDIPNLLSFSFLLLLFTTSFSCFLLYILFAYD